jgi:hypothetical protein
MLNVATVQVQNYEGRGGEYLRKFYEGIDRHMPSGVEWLGVCFTDNPDSVPDGIVSRPAPSAVSGWWCKLGMFREDAFLPGERVLFSDLDALFVGDLADIAAYQGKFAALRDPYFPDHLGSALMAWEAGTLHHVWERYDNGGRPQFDPRGDQFWIETVQPEYDRWQDMFPGQVVSFKANCLHQGKMPDDARVCVFHGHPRPHQCRAPYIKNLWSLGDDNGR